MDGWGCRQCAWVWTPYLRDLEPVEALEVEGDGRVAAGVELGDQLLLVGWWDVGIGSATQGLRCAGPLTSS